MTSVIPSGRIKKVRFQVSGTEEILEESDVPITKYDLYKQGKPFPGGVYDGHLGTTSHEYTCQTCFNEKKFCFGHDGHHSLNQPVISPLYVNEIKKWLRVICFTCGNAVVDASKFMRFPITKRLDEAAKIAKSGWKSCSVCRTEHPSISKDQNRFLLILAKTSTGAITKLYPHIIEEILNRISDEVVISFGKNPKSHPRKFILRAIKIPPTTIRPDVRKSSTGRSSNDDLTMLLQQIIRRNEKLPQNLPDIINDELEENIYSLQDYYYAYVRGSHSKRVITNGSNTALNSLAQRLLGKFGLFRKNQQGKRVRIVARSTISGDPTLQLEEIGIPLKFAKLLQMEEVVQEFNRKRLMINFLNGKKKYPGCSKIIRKRTGTEHNVEDPHSIPELEIGDILMRDLQDGDYVLFNRQPSLLPSSICGMRVVVTMDPDILTIRMNVLICSLFNADFDGDQMNIYVGSNLACRLEIKNHSSVPNFFIKHANSAPLIGQADDSIIGSFLLTRNGVKFDKYHAMLLFGSTTTLPLFSQKEYSTRDIITLHLQETPINYSTIPKYFDKQFKDYIKYKDEDIKVVIERGVHVSGVLDKKSIGKGSIGGLYHTVSTRYGEKKALEVIYNMQQVALGYLQQAGFSIGIQDILINPVALKKIHEIESSIIDKSYRVTQLLDDGKMIPPVGKTTEEFYEEQQIAILRIMDDFSGPIFESIDPATNNLMQLILSGSKGSINHCYHISSAIGQIVINDKRPKKQFAYARTLGAFTRFDTSPMANGFILNSYISGMNAVEFAFNAQNARADFITKTLYTSVTGDAERKSIKNLESLLTNNMRMCVKYNNIVQLIYAENGLDSRRVVKIVIPTIMISNAEFEKKFSYVSEAANASKELQAVFADEFKQIAADRAEYRRLFLKIESGKFNELFSAEKSLAMDIEKIISDTIYAHDKQKPTIEEIAQHVGVVKAFTQSIPYVMINEIQEKAKSEIPEHILESNWILIVYIRSILNAKYSLCNLSAPMLEEILNRIRLRQARALCSYGTAVGIIAAMSFSEPLTQYMLDAHHRTTTGGTSKSAMTIVKEILGAKKKSQLIGPMMVAIPYPDYASEVVLSHIANHIELMRLKSFVRISQIFFEKYGDPVHPQYVHEKEAVIKEFEKQNPLIKPPTDLLKWCIRFVLNRSNLIYKNMPLETIINSLREVNPDLHFVYTGENSSNLIIRVYIRTTYFKSHVEQESIEELRDVLLETAIRGVNDILDAKVEKLNRFEVKEDGKIDRTKDLFCVTTAGTNLSGMFKIKAFDPYQMQTDSIEEIQNILGIEAARQKLFTSIRNLGAGGLNMHHVSIYVDEMTYTGAVTSIERQGLSKRETSNVLLRMGFSAPIQTLEEAAINCMEDPVQGITSPLLVGDIPLTIGTAYNQFHINEALVKENTVRPDDWLDELEL